MKKEITHSRAYRRVQKRMAVYAGIRYQQAYIRLLELIDVHAADPIISAAAYRVAREAHSGEFGLWLYTSGQLLIHWYRTLRWWTRRLWWLVRFPGQHWTDIQQRRFDAMVADHDREVREAGYDPADFK